MDVHSTRSLRRVAPHVEYMLAGIAAHDSFPVLVYDAGQYVAVCRASTQAELAKQLAAASGEAAELPDVADL